MSKALPSIFAYSQELTIFITALVTFFFAS